MRPSRRLLISPRAAADLEEIAAYIARDNPARAASFVAELYARCQAIVAAPEACPARPSIGGGVRMAVHRRFLVFYRDLPTEAAVRIERVLHGARDQHRIYLPEV